MTPRNDARTTLLVPLTTEEQQEIDDRRARAQVLSDIEYVKGHAGLDTCCDTAWKDDE